MGLLRGGITFFLGIVLLITLILGNLFLTINLSLSYENVKEKIVPFIENESQEGIGLNLKIEKEYSIASSGCQTNSDYSFSYGGHNFDIPCDIVKKGSNATLDYGVSQIVYQVYYQDYSCGFFECLKKGQYFSMVSKQSKDYWKGKFILFLFISLAITGIMFFFVENKISLLEITGFLLIISSLPFMKISNLLSFLDSSILKFIPLLFSESYKVFLITFILGVLLVLANFAIRFFSFGNSIMNMFSKNKKTVKSKKEED